MSSQSKALCSQKAQNKKYGYSARFCENQSLNSSWSLFMSRVQQLMNERSKD